jgi:LPS-assembly protein
MPGWVFMARSQSFQTLQDPAAPVVAPYRRTQFTLNGIQGINLGSNNWGPGPILTLNSEAVDFSHPTMLNGKRFTLYPSISLPLNQIYGYITPKVGLHFTRYNFGDNAATQPDLTRTLPIFTLDSGLYFDRKVDLFGNSYEQTLEPRLYYVRTPFRDQSQIPLFDSGDFGFGMPQIFSENRFTGYDRISDANQVTAGVTSRIMDDMGLELLRGTVAQRYYLNLPQVTLPGGVAPTRKYSDILASLGGKLTQGLNLYSLWQYDPELKQTSNLTLNGRYQPGPSKTLNVSYRYTPGVPLDLKQIDASAQWPLSARWNGLARWNYSISDNKVLESLAGLEYNAGCWAFRAVVHSLAISSTDRSNAIFFQLELNGVSSIGSNPLEVLRRNIYGYTKTTDIPYENDTPYLP